MPLPPQDPNTPHPQGQTIFSSGCGVDEGESLPEVPQVPQVPYIKPPKGVRKDATMTAAANAQINCVYESLIQQQNIKDLLDMFGTSLGLTLVIKAETPPATRTGFRPNGQTIPINSNGQIVIYINPDLQTNGYSPLGIAKTIAHEIMHARLMAMIHNAGGMNTSQTQLANVAQWRTMADVFTDYSGTPANELQNLAQHEFIALYWHADLVAMIKQFDGNRATQTQYEALAWDGLEMTERYSGFMPNSLGYSDDYMDKNRKDLSKIIKATRQNENPCR